MRQHPAFFCVIYAYMKSKQLENDDSYANNEKALDFDLNLRYSNGCQLLVMSHVREVASNN